ncbi:MAG: hypothetical protein KIT14_19785 [bacterium]|nr:hypothetical protein [bacterium]
MLRALPAVLALAVLVLAAPAAARKRPPACPDGGFIVTGTTLTGLPGSSDGVFVVGKQVRLASGCDATKLRRRSRAARDRLAARWKRCTAGDAVVKRVRLRARVAAPACDTLEGTVKVRGRKKMRFTATRSRCGDGVVDGSAGEICDDGNTTPCDGCSADCTSADTCIADCAAYTRPTLAVAACPDPNVAAPAALAGCGAGAGHLGAWVVDADGLPAYDFAVDQRCDAAAHAFSPRPTPLRDPIHVVADGRGTIAMAHASGAVELYSQDRGHKWINRVDTWTDPENPGYPPQVGGGFSYYGVDDRVGSTRFEDLPIDVATGMQARRFGVGYVETVTHDGALTIRRRTYAPGLGTAALAVDVTIENAGGADAQIGLVELWDVNLHQVSLELLTSDVLIPGTTDGIARRRRAQAAAFTHAATWDPAARTAVLTTAAKTLPGDVTSRDDPSFVDFFPDPVFLAVLDDGPAPDRVWLADAELWPDGTRRPPATVLADGDGAPARTRALDGAGQPAVLALRVPATVPAGGRVTRRFAFGHTRGGAAPAASVAALRAAGPTLAADTAAAWRDRLVWAAFPGLPDAATIQRELAWASYGALASVSQDEYRGRRVLGQGGAYRFIHGLDGAMGDLALFAEAVVLVDPEVARDTLAYAFTTQHAAGQTRPGRFPYATTGVGQFSDVIIYDLRSDAYWFLPSALGTYVGLTRDRAFLETPLPFWPKHAGDTGTVLEHVARGLDFAELESVLGYGARGLVAMGTNDYADGVNALAQEPVTPNGTSSAYNAGMIALGFPPAADVIEAIDPELATRMRAIADGQAAALRSEAWTGRYFLRGFVDSGNPLAPDIFFLEPQVLPILAGLADPTMTASALDEVAALLETPYGAISNVAIGDAGPPTGIDLPLIGGVWPVANAWLTAAWARRDPAAGWDSFRRNTLAAHAAAFPELWYGIWTGPDSFNGPDKERPGEADAHPATALTDYPALNVHVHAGPLRALQRLVGVEGTADGLRLAPVLPTETFHVRWPQLTLESRPDRIAGTLRTAATAPLTLTVGLPSLLAAAPSVQATVGGAVTTAAVVDGAVVLVLPADDGTPVAWAITPAP